MKVFKCIVEKKSQFEIEIDETKMDENWMEHFRTYFSDIFSLDEHVEQIAKHVHEHGISIIEGYGIPLKNGNVPFGAERYDINDAINVKLVSSSLTAEAKEKT